jgi:predicted transcriptional regulator YdeE
LLKIGEFSKATGMTIKALRHYENLGLIRPYWIDKYTGYRYYEETQVLLVRRIAYLKSLGFSLREVQRLLLANLTEEEQLRIFEKKKHDVKGQLEQDQWRLSTLDQHLLHPHPLDYLDQSTKEISMELEIKKLPGFKVVGLLYFGKNEHQEISALWERFNERGEELCPRDTKVCYGVCRVPGLESQGKLEYAYAGEDEKEQSSTDTKVDFEYVAGVVYKEGQPLPEGTVVREVPECTVAVFKHVGAADTLHQTYNNIYNTWLPASAYQPLETGFDMEVYTDEFTYFAPDSVMYIYVPIKPKTNQ